MTEREKMASASGTTPILTPSCAPSGTKRPPAAWLSTTQTPATPPKRPACKSCFCPTPPKGAHVTAPFQTDYGYNCYIGTGTDINRGAYLMDGAKITIGEHCFIGPNCGMYTANHPLCYAERNRGFEQAAPITIGDNVWIGGDVTILPGVTIGSGAVIGAGSVVTKDIPADTLAYGNPCKPRRPITEADKVLDE